MAVEMQQNREELTLAEADVLQQMAQTNSDLNKAVRDAETTINQQVITLLRSFNYVNSALSEGFVACRCVHTMRCTCMQSQHRCLRF